MALLPFDELNTPKVEVEPPEQYFSKMAISKEQKEERVETANDLMDVLLFFFALLAIEMESVSPDYDMVYRKFKKRFRDVVADHSRMDDYQDNYVDEYTLQQYELTRRHMEAAGVGSGNTDAGWWTSVDRAMAIGENAANIILNHEELLQAAEAGAVGKKWIDKADNRVRKSHLAVTKKIIPLEEYFVVGDGIMLFPCDWDNNPDECYNCRCSCHYFDNNGKQVKVGNANRVNQTGEKAQFTETSNSAIVNSNRISDEEQQESARNEVKRRIAEGEYNLELNVDDYNKHVKDTPTYKTVTEGRGREPSRLFISFEQAQKIIKELSGTGRILLSKKGKIMDQEFISLPDYIGEYFNGEEWVKTRRVSIHYGKKSSHIVPVKEEWQNE